MVHLFWDFKNNEDLKKLDPLRRVDLIVAFKQLGIPMGYTPGFDKPYIEIDSTDPVVNHPCFKEGMIPRAGYITLVAVRHLTYQDDKFIEQVQQAAREALEGS